MPPPRYLRSDPDGLDVFQAEDGSEVRVDSSRSPYAQSLIGSVGQGPAEAPRTGPDPRDMGGPTRDGRDPATGLMWANGRPFAMDALYREPPRWTQQQLDNFGSGMQAMIDGRQPAGPAPAPQAPQQAQPNPLEAVGGFMRSATPLILPGGDAQPAPMQPLPFFEDLNAPPPPGAPRRVDDVGEFVIAGSTGTAPPGAQPPPADLTGVPVYDGGETRIEIEEPTMTAAPPGARGIDPSMNPFQQATADYGRAEAEREQRFGPRPYVGRPQGASGAAGASSALDLTGAGGGRAGGRRMGGGGGRSMAPAVDPLDALMVPGGYQDPTRAIAGSPRDRMLDRGEALIDRQGDAMAARAGLAGQAADMAREAVEEGERRRVELENERRAAMGAARDRFRRANERVAAMQVDPGRMFRQPGDVIGAAIGIALGAAASAVSDDPSHQQNALALIQQHVDRDIEAQRANINNAQHSLAGEESLVALMGQEFESREAAEQAARAAMLNGIAARVQRMEADLGTGEARLQAEQMRYDLQQQAAAAQAAALAAEEDRQIERALALSRIRQQNARAARDERRGAGGGVAASRAPSAATMAQFNQLVGSGADPAEVAASLRIDPEFMPRDGFFQAPTTGEQAGTVATLSAQLDALERLIPRDSEEDIAGIGMTGMLPDRVISEQGRAVRQQLASVTEMLGRLHSGGAISDDEFTRFGTILGADTDEGLRRGIEGIRREIGARMNRQGDGRSVTRRTDESLGSVGARRVE